jgi:hypothetical protein
VPDRAAVRRDGGEVHDRSAALAHRSRCGLAAEERAADVHRNDSVEVLLSDRKELLAAKDAGTVDHCRQPTELLGGIDRLPQADRRRHIDLYERGCDAPLAQQLDGVATALARVPPLVGDDDRCGAVVGERERGGPADAAGRAGDHRDPAGQQRSCHVEGSPGPLPGSHEAPALNCRIARIASRRAPKATTPTR